MKISVVICSYNREDFILKALDSIYRQTLSKSKYECVIINNNSTDKTGEICQKFISDYTDLQSKYKIEKNQGLSYARNRGILESSGDIVVFIDDDAIAEEDFLEIAYKFFEKNQNVSCIGGKILLHFIKEKPKWYNRYLASLLGYFNMGDKEKPFKNNYPRGSNMFFKKALFEKYGYFDVNLGRKGNNLAGAEEKEINLRMRGSEKIHYVPQAVVHHIVPKERTTIEFIKKQAIGTGKSYQKIFYERGFNGKMTLFVLESMKWAATMLLALGYLLTFRPAKALMIIRFRAWVLNGIKS